MKIGFTWHSFKSGNLGVGALSICNFHIVNKEIEKLGIKAEFVFIGNSGPFNYPPEKNGGDFKFLEFSAAKFFTNPVKIIKEIASCDIIFDIGEGDSFSDIYGLSRFSKMSISKLVSVFKNRKLVLSPQTIGPFESKISKIVSKFIMSKCSVVVARDYQSKAILDAMQLNNTVESVDVAFLLPFNKNLEKSDKIRVGLNVSALLYHGGYNKTNQFGLRVDYSELINKLIQKLVLNDLYEVHLIPHVIPDNMPVENDYVVAMDLHERYPSTIVSPLFKSPIEAKSYIAGMDFFAGARMHATIAAFSAGVPVLPMAYSRKFNGLYESIGYKRILDLKSMDEKEIIEAFLNGLSEKAVIKQEVEQAIKNVQTRLDKYIDAVRQVLKGIERV